MMNRNCLVIGMLIMGLCIPSVLLSAETTKQEALNARDAGIDINTWTRKAFSDER